LSQFVTNPKKTLTPPALSADIFYGSSLSAIGSVLVQLRSLADKSNSSRTATIFGISKQNQTKLTVFCSTAQRKIMEIGRKIWEFWNV
jgi:hypothetical protein